MKLFTAAITVVLALAACGCDERGIKPVPRFPVTPPAPTTPN